MKKEGFYDLIDVDERLANEKGQEEILFHRLLKFYITLSLFGMSMKSYFFLKIHDSNVTAMAF